MILLKMNCPNCNNVELKEHISLRGLIFKKKVYTYFCPVCDFTKSKEFALSKEDKEIDILQRSNLEKKSRQTYHTTRREV